MYTLFIRNRVDHRGALCGMSVERAVRSEQVCAWSVPFVLSRCVRGACGCVAACSSYSNPVRNGVDQRGVLCGMSVERAVCSE